MLARTFARFALPLSVAIVTPTLGCGGSVSSSPAASAGATRAPVAQGAHGRVKLFGAALGDVPLTAPQRAELETLAAEADARHAESRAAQRDLVLAVALQVESGAIDRAALQPKIDTLVGTIKNAEPLDRAAFEKLHAILGPDQRTAFVDALEARVHEGWGAKQEKHPMRQWAEDLRLSDAQRAQIKDVLAHGPHSHGEGAPWAHAKARGAKLLDAFKQDRFVMDEIAPANDVGQRAAMKSEKFLGIATQVLPILTVEQRSLAAQKLREQAEVFLF